MFEKRHLFVKEIPNVNLLNVRNSGPVYCVKMREFSLLIFDRCFTCILNYPLHCVLGLPIKGKHTGNSLLGLLFSVFYESFSYIVVTQ